MENKKGKRACVIGDPVKHSLSPVIHGYWLDKYGIDGSYEKIEVKKDQLETFIQSLAASGFAGCNVTVPHKEAVFHLLPKLTETARRIGAVNTVIVQEDGSLLGDNTDAYGFIQNIKETLPKWSFARKTALVIGAGGAAKAVVAGLIDAGVSRVILTNRTREKADKIAAIYGDICQVLEWEKRSDCLEEVDLVANTTTLGMEGFPPLEIDLSKLRKEAVVTDIVYKPMETDLLKQAKINGNQVVGGLGMLLYQAVPGFKAWFGSPPSVTEELRNKLV